MYNRLKTAQAITHEKMLQEQTKADGLSVDGITNKETQLDKLRTNKNIIDTTEVQLIDAGRSKVSETVTEERLNTVKSTLTTLRDDRWDGANASPLAVLNHAQEKEKLDAYKAAETGETAFWDKYVVERLLFAPENTPLKQAPSQLANAAERFKGKTTDPYEVNNTKVKKMVMASLKDADAMLFDIYVKAAGRELSPEENTLIAGITADKARILTAQMAGGMGPVHPTDSGESEIEKLHRFVTDPNTPHDEHWEEAHAKLSNLMADTFVGEPQQQPSGGNGPAQTFASAEDGYSKENQKERERYQKNYSTGKLEVKPEYAKCPKCNGKKANCPQCNGKGHIRR